MTLACNMENVTASNGHNWKPTIEITSQDPPVVTQSYVEPDAGKTKVQNFSIINGFVKCREKPNAKIYGVNNEPIRAEDAEQLLEAVRKEWRRRVIEPLIFEQHEMAAIVAGLIAEELQRDPDSNDEDFVMVREEIERRCWQWKNLSEEERGDREQWSELQETLDSLCEVNDQIEHIMQAPWESEELAGGDGPTQ